ncbi:MAG: peptide chain release factor 1, partial [Methanomicrobiales archaeon]|nr:peptide chain release factor 1 [Methanomicrobiales archaeon]
LDIIKEKNVMNRFLQELVKDDGASSYGEESVRKNLELGAVDTLLLSDKLRRARLKLACPNDDYTEERTISIEPGMHIKDLDLGTCPKDGGTLYVAEESDIIDELTALADQSSTTVRIISDDFEEGSMLYNAFGGIAAILRYRTGY